MVTKWMGDRYVLGFAPALRFLRSQIMYRLCKSPSDETINRGIRLKKRSHTHVKDHVVYVRVRRIMETPK